MEVNRVKLSQMSEMQNGSDAFAPCYMLHLTVAIILIFYEDTG